MDTNRREAKLIFRQVMALALLPKEEIRKQYQRILKSVNLLHDNKMRRKIRDFMKNYVRAFWIDQIGPKRFSVYGIPHKSNNCCEVISVKSMILVF
jgi:hypothetical protein